MDMIYSLNWFLKIEIEVFDSAVWKINGSGILKVEKSWLSKQIYVSVSKRMWHEHSEKMLCVDLRKK
jgi:putative transposon-encoded protein